MTTVWAHLHVSHVRRPGRRQTVPSMEPVGDAHGTLTDKFTVRWSTWRHVHGDGPLAPTLIEFDYRPEQRARSGAPVSSNPTFVRSVAAPSCRVAGRRFAVRQMRGNLGRGESVPSTGPFTITVIVQFRFGPSRRAGRPTRWVRSRVQPEGCR